MIDDENATANCGESAAGGCTAAPAAGGIPSAGEGLAALAACPVPVSAVPPRPHKPKAERKPFNVMGGGVVHDEKSSNEDAPADSPRGVIPGVFYAGHFVPVSFVAKDWKVTPRRIRALLTDGRLAGRLRVNGYWEVHFPYVFRLGTRGPGLKRQERPEKRERRAE